jgi:anti-sigma regulatory factor (Ser/Thr protein kinase)
MRSLIEMPVTAVRATRGGGLPVISRRRSSHGGGRMTANHPSRPAGRSGAAGSASAAGHHADATATATAPRVDWCVTVPGVAGMVRTARHLVRAALAHSPRIDELELITSELVTNAIRHTPSGDTGSTVTLRIRGSAGWARIEVTDLGSAAWAASSSPPGGERGRGLVIVHALADEAGHRAVADGHLSWAELSWTDPPTTAPPAVPPAADDDRRRRDDTHTGA